MKLSDSSELRPPIGDLDALVARIHRDLRREREAKARHERTDRRKTAIAMLLLLATIALAIGLYTVV